MLYRTKLFTTLVFFIVVEIILLMNSQTAHASLRFLGNANNDDHRVKILIDDSSNSNPGPAVDVGGGDFTLEFWMKAADGNTSTGDGNSCGRNNSWIWGNIIIDKDRYEQGRSFGLSLVNGVLRYGNTNGSNNAYTICGVTNVLDGQWHYVAVQRRRSDGWMWLYVDGNLESQVDGPDGDISYPDDGVPHSSGCSGPCDFSDPYLVIGAEKHDLADDFSGWVEEIRLSNILRNLNSVPTKRFVTDSDTVALYHFDEGSGSIANDTSGAINGPSHGEIRPGVQWSMDSPFTVGGGSPASPHSPTPQLVDVTDNTWMLISQGDVTSPANIMSYSGGWYDPSNHQYCIFGGGHWDYSGNEVWCLDIATLIWKEVYAPDVVTTQGGNQGAYNNYDNTVYPGALFNPAGESINNAKPMSRHSYDQMEYVEGLGPVIWGGYMWGDGVTTDWCDMCADTWAFNFTAASWLYLYDGSNPSPNKTAGVGASAYSSASKLLYALVTGDTWTFNPVNNRWTQITTTGTAPFNIEMTMEYDSKRNVLYTFGGTYPDNPNLYQFDIASSTWTLLTPTGNGPDASTVRGPGVAYDQANDVLLVYKAGNIWAYDPNSNSWAQYNSASSPTSNGYDPYGRFRYDPINNGAWLHDWQDGQHTTWFYRFSNSGIPPTQPPAPTVTFSAAPMSVAVGGQTNLTWISNANTCTASGDWADIIDPSGSITKTINSNSNFVLTCSLNGRSTVKILNVQISETNSDTDRDGLLDSWEQQYFGNLNSDAEMDNDQDGLSNSQEFDLTTNPILSDTDGDSVNDGDEVSAGTDPLTASIPPPGSNTEIVDVTIANLSNSSQYNLSVTFGHAFKVGDIPASATVGAKLKNNAAIDLQVDKKATHADGSLRHAVITAKLPSINNGGSETISLFQSNTSFSGADITVEDLLATTFDATVTLNINGVAYFASARNLLETTTPETWLSGALVSEWLVNGPVKTSASVDHPHLTARFALRAFEGLDRVRVSVTIENSNVLVANPGVFTYDVSLIIQGQNEILVQSAVPHYRQSRWRRVFWWGTNPQVHVTHDKNYFELTRAIPTYDPNVSVPEFRLNDWLALYNQNSDLMEFGLIDPYMPGGGARDHGDIAPLPGWTATWLLSQDPRAKTYMLGTDAQAGTYNVHFRDEKTGYPIRATDHTNWQAYVSDDSGGYYPPGLNNGFPSFAQAEPSHEPDIAYVPYLITGDYFYLEEMQFWASWNIMYSSFRGEANGYVVWDQVRGQAWSLRSIAHAAYATPDTHPLKTYYLTILDNNRQRLENKWLNTQSSDFRWPAIGVNPLGYITNEDWLGYTNIMASWMDDFMTWSVGHISALGFTQWNAFRDYKVRFPVGRTIDPASCWVLAPTYWPDILDTYPGGTNTGNPVTTWQAWKEAIVYSSNNGSLVNAYGADINLAGLEPAFLATTCASSEMYGYLTDVGQDEMIGYSLPDSYIANLQAALAIAVEAGYPNAQSAYDQVQLSTNLPNYNSDGRPAWALAPYTGSEITPIAPTISLTAIPQTVAMNGSTTLTWFVSNATSCTASDNWADAWTGYQGSVVLSQLTVDSTYSLICVGAGETINRSVTITVMTDDTPGGETGGGETGGGTGEETGGGGTSGGEIDSTDNNPSSGSGSLNFMTFICFFLLILIRQKILDLLLTKKVKVLIEDGN